MRPENPGQEAFGSIEPDAVLRFFSSSVRVLEPFVKRFGILEPKNR
jgi:hypothetical protein